MIGAFASGKFPSPAPIANAVSQSAEILVEQFRQDVKDFSQAHLHSEVLLLGPEPQNPAIGTEAAKKLLRIGRVKQVSGESTATAFVLTSLQMAKPAG